MKIQEAHDLLEEKNCYLKDAKKLTDSKQLELALPIFNKYYPKGFDMHSEHDKLYVCDFNNKMTEEEIIKLNRLGFHLDTHNECWCMFN